MIKSYVAGRRGGGDEHLAILKRVEWRRYIGNVKLRRMMCGSMDRDSFQGNKVEQVLEEEYQKRHLSVSIRMNQEV